MQAIKTRYYGPTNTKDARIRAVCAAGAVTIPYPHELSGQDVHAAAAMHLVRKLGWDADGYPRTWVAGGLPDGGYVFVTPTSGDTYNSSF